MGVQVTNRIRRNIGSARARRRRPRERQGRPAPAEQTGETVETS